MHWIDWAIVIIPLICIICTAVYVKKYVSGVVDYLAAGRVAGRYVISVGDLQSSLSVITLVALVEIKYQTGYAIGFWENIMAPLGIVMSLTGYCVYRFRQTKSLSLGQFLEMRYSKSFRIFAASLRTIAEMITNSIGPAIAANFFIYFLGIPHKIMLFGFEIPAFALVVVIVLTLAMAIVWPGGRISLLVTDCIQGLMSYPIFVLIAGYILVMFSWDNEIAPTMLDRAPGENFLNPFDIDQLRDFNIFALVVSVLSGILNRASWIGNDTTNSGRTPHEQKMAGILGAWRNGFSWMMCMLIAVSIITVMAHRNFAERAHSIRVTLFEKVADEVVSSNKQKAELLAGMKRIPVQEHHIGIDAPLGRNHNLDTPYMNAAVDVLAKDGAGREQFQKFRTLYHQMMMPIALREILPIGIMGVFALLMVMLLISTDDSRIFNASATLVQDVILPFHKELVSARLHLIYLRLTSLGVAVFFLCCSLMMVQLDYISMFTTIVCSLWVGGAGPVMIFGLYSRFGTTAGAYAALITGAGISGGGILLQRKWANLIYPFLEQHEVTASIDSFLRAISAPFNPYILWQMDPVKFPINSMEIYFISMVCSVTAYIIISLLTCKEPYNLDKLLHRGVYNIDHSQVEIREKWTFRNLLSKLIGITPEYTKGDKFIAWSVFVYTFVFNILICFIGVFVWNLFSPWPMEWWSRYFFVTSLLIGGIVGVVSTIWFFVGGIIDGRRLFKDLSAKRNNPLDNGQVDQGVSLSDIAYIEKIDKKNKLTPFSRIN